MSNYVNFKLLGKALEQTKSYKNQQIDRNFYSYLKKIGCLYSYWKQDAVWKKSIQPVYSTVCTKQMVLVLTVRFRWSDFFATHSFPLLVQWLLGLICEQKAASTTHSIIRCTPRKKTFSLLKEIGWNAVYQLLKTAELLKRQELNSSWPGYIDYTASCQHWFCCFVFLRMQGLQTLLRNPYQYSSAIQMSSHRP